MSKRGKFRKITDYNVPGVIRLIFSFISGNDTCFKFALSSKSFWITFYDMLNRSSNSLYRLNYLNGKRPKDYTFDIFKPPIGIKFKIDERFYVTSIEAYLKNIMKVYSNPIIQPYDIGKGLEITIIQICEKINKKYGRVAMISGSYALRAFLKSANFIQHSDSIINKYTHPPKKAIQEIEGCKDIDIFILGPNKPQIAREILKEFGKKIIYPKQYVITSRPGLYDVKIAFSHDLNPNYIQYFQLILKSKAITPNDVFTIFDLDICKIGYFPGLDSVIVPIDFIRTIHCGKNYSDLEIGKIGWKHKQRIIKYFCRTGIRTTIKAPPLMSFYHYHINQVFSCGMVSGGAGAFDGLHPDIKQQHIHNSSYPGECNVIECGFDNINVLDIKCQNEDYYYKCYGIRKIGEKYVYQKNKPKQAEIKDIIF